MATRICTTCNTEKPLEEFDKRSDKKDGYGTRCKICGNVYKRQHKLNNLEHYKENARRNTKNYNKKHPEKVKQIAKKYRDNHSEKVKEWKRNDWNRNIDARRLKCRENYIKNKEDRKKYVVQWQKDNPEKTIEYRKKIFSTLESKVWFHNRRALKRLSANGIKITAINLQDMYIQQQGKCFYCGNELNNRYELEHIIPISKGGEHKLHNLVLSCKSCNLHKGAKDPETFINEILKVA